MRLQERLTIHKHLKHKKATQHTHHLSLQSSGVQPGFTMTESPGDPLIKTWAQPSPIGWKPRSKPETPYRQPRPLSRAGRAMSSARNPVRFQSSNQLSPTASQIPKINSPPETGIIKMLYLKSSSLRRSITSAGRLRIWKSQLTWLAGKFLQDLRTLEVTAHTSHCVLCSPQIWTAKSHYCMTN